MGKKARITELEADIFDLRNETASIRRELSLLIRTDAFPKPDVPAGIYYWNPDVPATESAQTTIGDVARKHLNTPAGQPVLGVMERQAKHLAGNLNTQDQGMTEMPDAYATAGRDVTRDVAGLTPDNTVNADGLRKDSPMAKGRAWIPWTGDQSYPPSGWVDIQRRDGGVVFHIKAENARWVSQGEHFDTIAWRRAD